MRARAEHGGAFWHAIGADFRHMNRRSSVINADVLDAWFPPSPRVIEALAEPMEWLCQTSPPTDAEGLLDSISSARGLETASIALGAGSSDLIFRAFLLLFDRNSRALIPDPTYSEYAHVFADVVGGGVERLPLDGYEIDLERAAKRLDAAPFDLFVLVNPNSPTGHCHSADTVRRFVDRVPSRTTVWIDEAYADYAGVTTEALAGTRPNIVVCKSMSKAYSLSGLRVGYAVAHPSLVAQLNLRTPPWTVSLPAQLAGVAALADPPYYTARWSETSALAEELRAGLAELGGAVYRGCANFVLWRLPDALDADAFATHCEAEGLFLRRAASIGAGLDNTLRVSVKAPDVQARMLEICRRICTAPPKRDSRPLGGQCP